MGNGLAGYTRPLFGPAVSDGPATRDRGSTVLVVGAASRDVTTEDPRGWRLGGAVTYGSLTLARLGLLVRALIGVDGEAAEARELEELHDAGVEVERARLGRGPVFENIERPAGRRQRCLSVADPLDPAMLPAGWRHNDAVFLGPVAGELGSAWASITAPFVVLGWQGLLRRLVPGEDVERIAPRPEPLLAVANLVGVSGDDVDPRVRLGALVDLVRPGATLVVTRGDRGGTALVSRRPARSTLRAYPAIPSNGVVDPTGAGDVFLAAVLGATLDGARLGVESLAARLTFAAAAGSLTVERPGVDGVPSLEAIRRRVADVV